MSKVACDISVLLPVFGTFPRALVPVCLESMARQEGVQVEVIVSHVEGEEIPSISCGELACRSVPVPKC